MVQDVLISIFIPVYNGEKYLEQTLFSIKNQTYVNFEVLLVNDSSTDGSLAILNAFAKKDSRFKIYTKANGGMTSMSWNFILPKIAGDFVFYASQDDLFSENLIEKMVERQKKTHADTIISDMEFYFKNSFNNKKVIGLNGDRAAILDGKQACKESLTWNISGFMLTAKKLFENEFFPEDAFDSDEFITRKWLFNSNKVAFSEGTFFYRQDNPNAITKTYSKKNFYHLNTLKRMAFFLKESNLDSQLILLSQFDLYRKIIKHNALYKLFSFDNQEDKNEIKQFLKEFKNQNASPQSILNAVILSKGKLQLKFRIAYLIYSFPFLFTIAVTMEVIRLKSKSILLKDNLQIA